MEAQARLTAYELARMLAPLFGGEMQEPAQLSSDSGCNPHIFVDGECRACGLKNGGGVLRYGEDAAECDGHVIQDGNCIKCGGRDMGGWVTSPSPRVLGRCEHARHEPNPGGGLRCLDCGSVGY